MGIQYFPVSYSSFEDVVETGIVSYRKKRTLQRPE